MRTIDLTVLARALDERNDYIIPPPTGRQSEGGEEIVWFAVHHVSRAESSYDVRAVFDPEATIFLPSGNLTGQFMPEGCNCKWCQPTMDGPIRRHFCKHECMIMLQMGTIDPQLRKQAERITSR